MRLVMARFVESHGSSLSAWLHQVEDPARRMDLFFKALEFTMPKMSRNEVTGADGAPLELRLGLINSITALLAQSKPDPE